MREERGNITGDVVIEEVFTLWGMIVGNVRVLYGGKFYLRGSVYGDLDVEEEGRCHIFGNLQGSLTVHRNAKVIHSGNIGGNATNRGGRLYVEKVARISGKLIHRKGHTRLESHKSLVQGPSAFDGGPKEN